MKECPNCGSEFLGFDKLCSSCTRRERHTPNVTEAQKNLPARTIDSRELCPHCKRPMSPWTNAERQRAWRERQQRVLSPAAGCELD